MIFPGDAQATSDRCNVTTGEKTMKERAARLLLALCVMAWAPVSTAELKFDKQGLSGDFGKLQVRGNFSASVQAASIDPVDPAGDTSDGALDGAARIRLEYTTDNAMLIGAVADIDSGIDQIDGFERNEFYVYLGADWGRIEVGENDGPADTLSYHAPNVGLGQVRGDFARYTGRVALFSPYDTRDSAKVTYLTPPMSGFRGGISFSPEFKINENDPDPLRRLIQEDIVEIAGQYNTIVAGTTYGVSVAYVTGSADSITGREDIDSFGIGGEINRGKWTLGAAFVDRGRSNLPPTAASQSEWNAGIAYREQGWSVAASFAISDELGGDISRFGVGGSYDFRENFYVAADVDFYEEDFPGQATRDGSVVLLEIGVRY